MCSNPDWKVIWLWLNCVSVRWMKKNVSRNQKQCVICSSLLKKMPSQFHLSPSFQKPWLRLQTRTDTKHNIWQGQNKQSRRGVYIPPYTVIMMCRLNSGLRICLRCCTYSKTCKCRKSARHRSREKKKGKRGGKSLIYGDVMWWTGIK